MPTAKQPCEHYLQSAEVIRILQSNNETFSARVLDCIAAFKAEICNNIYLSHSLLDESILQMCREDAFQQAQFSFVKNVRANRFAADKETCIPYIRSIFRNNYWYEYQQELKRKMAIQNMGIGKAEDDVEEADSEMQAKVQETLLQLNEEDRNIYRLRYEEGLKVKEIAALLHLLPQTVSVKLIRLHHRFSQHWKLP